MPRCKFRIDPTLKHVNITIIKHPHTLLSRFTLTPKFQKEGNHCLAICCNGLLRKELTQKTNKFKSYSKRQLSLHNVPNRHNPTPTTCRHFASTPAAIVLAKNYQIKRPIAKSEMRRCVEISSHPIAVGCQKQLNIICNGIPVLQLTKNDA
jgi:hypothetical protein